MVAARVLHALIGVVHDSGRWLAIGNRGSLQMTEKRRNGFWNPRKCFRMKVTPTVGV
jgi:hypothetical protein